MSQATNSTSATAQEYAATTVWPPPYLSATPQNVAIAEADAPLNLGLDDEEQVWSGQSVGLGFGLLTKGNTGLDSISWDCKLCLKTASDPCVTRCGHLFCWSHIHEYLTAGPTPSKSCPTCGASLNMDRDVVQVFGRPKAIPADAPWTTADTPKSDCSFGPPISEEDESTGSSRNNLFDHTQFSSNLIYPALSDAHTRQSSDRDSDIQPRDQVAVVPQTSPVTRTNNSTRRPSVIVDLTTDSDLVPHPNTDGDRRTSGISAASSRWGSQMSQSGSSAWDGESTYGSRKNPVDLRDGPEPSSEHKPRRMSLSSRPMKGFWSSKSPVNWKPPTRISVVPEEPVSPTQPLSPTAPLTSPTVPKLRTRGLWPGQSYRNRANDDAESASDSDDFSFKPFKPHAYPYENRPSQTRTSSSRKTFRNMDMDYSSPERDAAQMPPRQRHFGYSDPSQDVVQDVNPLSRALSLAALAVLLMVLLK